MVKTQSTSRWYQHGTLIAVGAGLGATVGVLIGGGPGIGIGLAVGAGFGVALDAMMFAPRVSQTMDDIEAIKQLKARYFRLMDTKDWAGIREVFAPDVQVDLRDAGGPVFDDVDSFMTMLTASLGDTVTVHHGHTPEIELTSPRPRPVSGRWRTCSGTPRGNGPSPRCTGTGTTTTPTSSAMGAG